MANSVDDFIEQQLEEIDSKIQEIDNHKIMRAAQKLLDQKAKLQAARRALLGAGPRTTGGSGSRVSQDEVATWMRNHENEGWTPAELAELMGHGDAVIRGHLNRGRHERFLKRETDGKWFLRDPKNDLDDEDDLPDVG